MLNKFLEKKIEITNEECLTVSEGFFELEYYLLESEINEIEDLAGQKVYGIEIVKRVNQIETENGTIKNFSCCKESTVKVLSKLADNTVTPVGLAFVMDDMIGI